MNEGGTPGGRRIERRAVDPVALERLKGLPPVVARLYAARGVGSAQEVDHGLSRLRSFDGLLGVGRAVEMLDAALRNDERILIVGDFDADGATSTAVAVRALRAFGARNVGFFVPNRFEFGYGLSPKIVDAAALLDPDILLTVDNGISSHAGVERARELGIRVLVTDHHLAPGRLPGAEAIVNPNQPGDNAGLGTLAGVGVAFYLMSALRAHLRHGGWFASRPEPKLARLLDLVALGTVADVAVLDANNRRLVSQGLARIRAGRMHAGLAALFAVAGRDPAHASARDLAFAIGPRLNAAGRLEDMRIGIECLLDDEPERCLDHARALDRLNRERRKLESQMTEEAWGQVSALLADVAAAGGEQPPNVLCLFDETWHPGVVGIVASRVMDELNRPVIAFAPDGGGAIKGSGRPIPGLHLRDALEAVAAERPDLVGRFGGHAMAAGLSVERRCLQEFTSLLDAVIGRRLPEDALSGVRLSDGPLAPESFDLATAKVLDAAGPWGNGFPEPAFDGDFEVAGVRTVGGRHARLSVRRPGRGEPLEAIAFNTNLEHLHPGTPIRLLYRLEVNRFRGRERLQLVVESVAELDRADCNSPVVGS